jgi:hypothetical protein
VNNPYDPNLTPGDTPLDLALDRATGDAPRPALSPITKEECAAANTHRLVAPSVEMPAAARARLLNTLPGLKPVARPNLALRWLALAAVLGIAGSLFVTAQHRATSRKAIEAAQTELAQAKETQRRLEADNAQFATRLTALTSELNEAKLTIARFEAPADPVAMAANRTKLLEVPDTIRVAWAPFDLPNKPAEQQGIQGDVVWNDKLQTGYLRFVGLKVNDPAVEQYQVWVIDERGMEQKVSGGIFNATAQGEVIVPIQPGIDVGRVALFAITIEKPGGTWVPDLNRRVVVAPRG